MPIKSIPRTEPLPLSMSQQYILTLPEFYPQIPPHYWHVPLCLTITGPLDSTILERCVSEIISRHETPRTGFVSRGGRLQPQITDTVEFSLSVIEIEELSEFKLQLRRLAQIPFDLTQPPLLRATLLRVHPNKHILIIIIHHLISDAWTQAVFLRELSKLYPAFKKNQPSPLRPLSIQYVDYAAWEQRELQSGALTPHLDYWTEQLSDLPRLLKLPTDRPRPLIRRFAGAVETLTSPAALSKQIIEFSRRHKVTPFTTLLAAFALLLATHSNQTDLLIGLPVANRTRAAFRPLVGCFAAILPLRLRLDSDQTASDFLQQTYQVSRAALAHQKAPIMKVVRDLKLKFHPGHWPLYQVVFSFQNAMISQMKLADLTIEANLLVWDSLDLARDDMGWQLFQTEQGLTGSIEYRTDLFEPTRIRSLIADYQQLLTDFIAHPVSRLTTFKESRD